MRSLLVEAAVLFASGTPALVLATGFDHQTPQVSQFNLLRHERDQLWDELEAVSSQLQQKRAPASSTRK